MLACRKCLQEKEDTEFNRRSATKLHTICKSCSSEYQKDHYRRNKDNRLYKWQAHKVVRRVNKRQMIDALKSVPCADCNQTYSPWIMQFDHVRGKKDFNLSDATRTDKSIAKIIAESEKCEVVCANCHADRTYKRRINGA